MTDAPVLPPPQTQKTFYDDFRKRLIEEREAAGYNQEQLADLLNAKYETYKKYETRSKFPLYLIPRLALALRLPVEFLVTGKSTSNNVTQMRKRSAS